MNARLCALILLLFLPAFATEASAEIDEVRSRLTKGLETPLRWYNVEGPPLLIQGPKTVTAEAAPLRLVNLSPGESVTVWLPAWETLRITAPDGRLDPGGVKVSLSTGSGLFRSVSGIAATDGASLLVAPSWPTPLLARIERNPSHRNPVRFALFVSMHEKSGESAPYRDVLPLPLASRDLGDTGHAGAERFWRLPARRKVSVPVNGPVRISLETRIIYPGGESRRDRLYRVFASLDGTPSHTLEFQAGPEQEPAVYGAGQPELLGRLTPGYLDIPAGAHSLDLEADALIYCRLLIRKRPDYLLPASNAPRPSATDIEQQELPPGLRDSFLSIHEREIEQSAGTADSLALLEQHAFRISRDNRRRDGGAVGAALLREAGRHHPEYPLIRERAEELAGLSTFYRELLPVAKETQEAHGFRWFLTTSLKEPEKYPSGMAVGIQHTRKLAGMVAGGSFVPLPNEKERGHRYLLPERFAPSLLRIAVPASAVAAEGELSVQLDDTSPVTLSLHPPPLLEGIRYGISPAEEGLALLHEQHGAAGQVTLGGAFAGERFPGELMEATTAELPLPTGARVVTIRRTAGNGLIPVAVQYRSSQPYRMTESEFLAATSAMTAGNGVYDFFVSAMQRFMKTGDTPDAGTAMSSPAQAQDIAVRELAGEWLPLLRLVRSLNVAYTASIAPPPAARPSALGGECATRAANAREAEKKGDGLAALEEWSGIVNAVDCPSRSAALLGQARALESLNEDYLAERILKGLLLHGPDAEARKDAFLALEARYGKSGDTDSLITLYAVSFLRGPTPALLRSLGESLLADGEWELGLQALLVLSPGDRPAESILRAAFRLGWWETFDGILSTVSANDAARWEGLRLAADGKYEKALDRLHAGGTKGEEWENHLRRGLAIRDELLSDDPHVTEKALAAWGLWQEEHPGPRSWTREEAAVDFAGGVSFYNAALDLHSKDFRSTRKRPVVLRIAGPVRVRIEARPLHPAGSRIPVEGWLQILLDNRLHVKPITNNLPSQGLSIVGAGARAPGLKVEQDLELGPGEHELQVSGGTLELAVRLLTLRPSLPSPALPPLTPETIARARTGHRAVKELHSGLRADGDARLPRMQILSRGGSESPREFHPVCPVVTSHFRPGDESILRFETSPLAAEEREAELLARGDIEGALAVPAGSSDSDVLRRLTLYLWLAEQKPDRYPRAAAAAVVLAAAHPGLPGATSILERLSRRSIWTAVTSITGSAGIRQVEIDGWQPEAPSLRIRKALLPPTGQNEQIVYDTGRLVLSMVNPSPISVEVNLKVDDLAYLVPQPMTVSCRLDNGPLRRIVLTPEKPGRKLNFQIPPGEHSIRIGIEQRFVDQYLRVNFETRQTAGGNPAGPSPPVSKRIERPYQIATAEEPLHLSLKGPALLRVDELRGGRTLVSYRCIGQGIQRITLAPDAGRREALYRLYTTTFTVEKPMIPSRYVEQRQDPTPLPLVTISEPPPAQSASLHDVFPLGRQEDGTWTLRGSLERRRAFFEGADGDTEAEQFAELGATYRFFDGERTWYRTDALTRIREHGGPTFGLLGEIHGEPLTQSFSWNLAGGLYLQNPGGGTGDPFRGGAEYSASLRGTVSRMRRIGPKTWHTPAVSLFGRLLSLKGTTAYSSNAVDQDIYTRYKDDHRYGAVISETLVHRPWMDTLWYGTAALTSNELFEQIRPDHVAVSIGWKQLIRDFQLNARYNVSVYFPDHNRTGSYVRNLISAELLYNHWLKHLHRLEVSLNVNGRPETGDITGVLSLSWHFGSGRGYRDFLPGEIDFLDIAKRRMPRDMNNRVLYEPDE